MDTKESLNGAAQMVTCSGLSWMIEATYGNIITYHFIAAFTERNSITNLISIEQRKLVAFYSWGACISMLFAGSRVFDAFEPIVCH
jgi:hypothetical protein